jgi:DtxR family Mn-dependent transcriptional regulator
VEHILSSEVTDSVCTFLGHPTHCPHGKAIPRGRCCEILLREVSPLVSRLLDLTVGERARIVFITPHTRKSLDRIATLGVVPGASMRLQQKSPAVVLEVGQTIVALDREIAAEIFVRRIHKEAAGR